MAVFVRLIENPEFGVGVFGGGVVWPYRFFVVLNFLRFLVVVDVFFVGCFFEFGFFLVYFCFVGLFRRLSCPLLTVPVGESHRLCRLFQ